MAAHVLIVDDDPAECRHVEEIVRNLGHIAESAAGGEAALTRLARADAPPISAVILDLVMPDLDGMAVLEQLARRALAVPVIVQATAGRIDAGAAALRAGAFDFLAKPAAAERVRASLANALRIGALENEILRMRLTRAGTIGLRDVIMQSPSMERVHRVSERAARSHIPVLVEGERGVGKERLARAIHASGPRRNRRFVKVECAELADGALDAALFGMTSNGDASGTAAEANGGTLFLDEIGSLQRATQRRLARKLAEREAEASAAGRVPRAYIRLVAATSRRLIDLVSEGAFDEELFYRLNVLPIWLPPLRERRADIPVLARGFLARIAPEAGRSFVSGISADAIELLAADAWPGNIRELEHTIFRAVMLCEGTELRPRDFPLMSARRSNDSELILPTAGGPQCPQAISGVAGEEQVEGERPFASARFADTRGPARYGIARLLDDRGDLRPFESVEEEVIRFAIDHYSGRMSEVARRLGIGRSTLYRRIKDYGIESPVTP
ncbi:MAG: sigma-54-dependent transcriptional regulator [Propylenella sp.]